MDIHHDGLSAVATTIDYLIKNTDLADAIIAARKIRRNMVLAARLESHKPEPVQEDRNMNTMTFKFLANISIEERWGVFETKTAFFDIDSPNFETSLPGFYTEEQKDDLCAKLEERLLTENGLDRSALNYMADHLDVYAGFVRSIEDLEVTLTVEGDSWEWISFSISDPVNHCNVGLDFLYNEEYADEMPEGWDY